MRVMYVSVKDVGPEKAVKKRMKKGKVEERTV